MSGKKWTPKEINQVNAEFWGERRVTKPMTADEVKDARTALKERRDALSRENPDLEHRIPSEAWETAGRYAELSRRYPEMFNRHAKLVAWLRRPDVPAPPDSVVQMDVSAPMREAESWLSEHNSHRGPRNPKRKEKHVVIEAMRPYRRNGHSLREFVEAACSGSVEGIATFEYEGQIADKKPKVGKWLVVCDELVDSDGYNVAFETIKDWWKAARG